MTNVFRGSHCRSRKSQLFFLLCSVSFLLIVTWSSRGRSVLHREVLTPQTSLVRTRKVAKKNLPLCSKTQTKLQGPLHVNLSSDFEWLELEKRYNYLTTGGKFRPSACKTESKIAIIVPYRNRDSQLKLFLRHYHPILRRQLLDYGVYIIEQEEGSRFNRAMLLNIGFIESQKYDNYTCFIFHDVDLLAEDDRNIYGCNNTNPRHMTVLVNTFRYKRRTDKYFGGVSAVTSQQMYKVNGYSNIYFGWGAEDHDMYNRLKHHKMNVFRTSGNITRYTMIRHGMEKRNPIRDLLLGSWKRHYKNDGLETNLLYKVSSVKKKPLFTLITVSIDEKLVTANYTDYIKDLEVQAVKNQQRRNKAKAKRNAERAQKMRVQSKKHS